MENNTQYLAHSVSRTVKSNSAINHRPEASSGQRNHRKPNPRAYYYDHHSQTITLLSLCSGCGGLELGLKKVFGEILRTIAYVEIEAFAIANLVQKIEAGRLDAAPVWPNLKTFPYEKFLGRVRILTAGFPCQPFSAVGKKRATEDPRHLWPYIAEGIGACRPEWVFVENVEGIIQRKCPDGEPVLLHVLRELERRGYTATWGVFTAAEMGATHLRKRVFILAHTNNQHGCGNLGRMGRTLPAGDGDPGGIRPARPGQKLHDFEPPRIIQKDRGNIGDEAEPAMGGMPDGLPCRLDGPGMPQTGNTFADRYRLLGNAVVPAAAETAFLNLYDNLKHI